MGASFPLAWPLSHDVIDSAGLPCFVAGAHRCGTRHTAVLEGTLRSGIRPSTFAGQRLNAATGGAKHGVCHLATGIGDEQVKLGSGGNVEHGLVRLVCSQYRPWRGVWSDGVCQLVDCHRNFLSNPRHTMRRASRTMKPDIVMLSKVQKRGGISPLSSDAFQRRKE